MFGEKTVIGLQKTNQMKKKKNKAIIRLVQT